MLVTVGTRSAEHSLRSQVGMGSESDCLLVLGQLNRILEISDSEAGLKVEKSGGVTGEEGECGDADVELLARERRSLDILSVKKEARLSVRALAEVEVRSHWSLDELRQDVYLPFNCFEPVCE